MRNRARLLRASADTHLFALSSDFMKSTKPAHVGWMFELFVARMEAEIAWCERIATRIDGNASAVPAGDAELGHDGRVSVRSGGRRKLTKLDRPRYIALASWATGYTDGG